MGLYGSKDEQLGNKRFEQGGRVYKYMTNDNSGTLQEGSVVVYSDYDQKSFDQPSTAKLSRIAGVLHNPDVDIDDTDTSYDVDTNENTEVCVSGPCIALVDGTTDVAEGDILKAVDGQNYFVLDATAQENVVGSYAIAREAQTTDSATLTKVLMVRNGS